MSVTNLHRRQDASAGLLRRPVGPEDEHVRPVRPREVDDGDER